MRHQFAAIAALVLLANPAYAENQEAQATTPPPLSSQDKQFLKTAAEDNHAEIEAALLAETKADNLAVKAFSRLMVDDHTMIASHFALLANSENFEAPAGIGEDGQKALAGLKALSGAEFDRKFMQLQVKDHEQVLRDFKKAEMESKDPGLLRFTMTTYPILEEHLALAKDVDAAPAKASRQSLR